MYSINVVVFLFTVSSFIDVVYTQDADQQESKLVCLNEDPYVLNVPKLLNVSLSGEVKVVHSNIDKITEIKGGSCNGIEPADLENYKNTIVEEFKHTFEMINATIKKEISVLTDVQIEDKKNMENLKEKIEDVHDILKEIKDTVKEIRKNVSTLTSILIPESCKELYARGKRVTGVYQIQPKSMNSSFDVFCDMETRGGGWTVIQNRIDGRQEFDLSWQEYKVGFGNISREFWIGLEKIYQMTRNEKNELLVEIVDRDGKQRYARYTEFGIGPETARYTLTSIQGFDGNLGDSLYRHVGKMFSTKDSDRSHENIQDYRGGWWLYLHSYSNLNGLYLQAGSDDLSGTFWFGADSFYSLAKTRMLIRPV